MIAGVSNREFQHIENASWQVADAFSWSYRGPQGKAASSTVGTQPAGELPGPARESPRSGSILAAHRCMSRVMCDKDA